MKCLKNLKWEALLMSVLYILMGIVVLVLPDTMAKTLGYLIGVVLIVAGAFSMICYLLRDAYQNYYHNDFLVGLVEIGLGCVVLYKVEWVISLIPFLLGLLVLISGCSKLQDAIDMKRLEYGNWIAMLIMAAVNAVLGMVLLFNPFEAAAVLMRIIGAGLIFSGITDCAATIYFAGKLQYYVQRKQDMEAEFKEVKEAQKDENKEK